MSETTDPRLGPPPEPVQLHRPWFFVALVAFIAVAARLVYVQMFSSPIPFWDQWDGEADNVLRPWIEGGFGLDELLRAHNEHRIVPTKLVTIALYEMTGRWSNLDEARFTALLYGAIPALLSWSAVADRRERLPLAYVTTLAALVLLFGTLPFSWENVLIGFQSQFYFMVAAGIAAMFLAARHHDNLIAIAGVVGLSAVACLTMASGLITPLVAICVYALACIFLPGRRWPASLAIAALLSIALLTYATTPQIPQHQMLRPSGLTPFLDALSHMLSWPVNGYHWAMFYLWTPAPAVLAWRVLQRRISRTDVAMAGLYGWSVAQALAIVAGRGEGLIEIPSRYVELLIPGLFANAWFALSLLADRTRLPARMRVPAIALPGLFFLVILGGFVDRTPSDYAELRKRSDALAVQRENTLQYLRTNDPRVFEEPFFALPYPDHGRLKMVLDTPAIRQALHWTEPLPPPDPAAATQAGN